MSEQPRAARKVISNKWAIIAVGLLGIAMVALSALILLLIVNRWRRK